MAEDKRGDTDGVEIGSQVSANAVGRRNPYAIQGSPDYHGYRANIQMKVSDLETPFHVQNDFYLDKYLEKPSPFFAGSLASLPNKYKGFKKVSAYNSRTKHYTDFAEAHKPKHGHTEGGKGLTMYSRPVVYATAGMSTLVNINIAFGCPASCSFCKESLLARGFTQASFKDSTGILEVDPMDGGEPIRNIPSKSRVKFFDMKNDIVVYGPIQVALANEFPIAKDSIKKLRSGILRRFISD